jgi:adenine deaminase
MARYSASGSQNLPASTTPITALTIAAQSTAHRNIIYDITIGNVGAPADLVTLHTIQRITAVGTAGSPVTPSKLDMADRASQSAAGEDHSSEPTYTSATELLEIPLNHRATFRWVAAPGGELVTPATNNSGIGAKAFHASATTEWRVGFMWEE